MFHKLYLQAKRHIVTPGSIYCSMDARGYILDVMAYEISMYKRISHSVRSLDTFGFHRLQTYPCAQTSL